MIQVNILAGTLMAHIMASMSLVFRLFLVGTVPPMVVTTLLGSTATGGLPASTHLQVPGTGSCTVATGMCTATTSIREMGSASVASGILTIRLF